MIYFKNNTKFLAAIVMALMAIQGFPQGESDYAAYLSNSLGLWERAVASYQEQFDKSQDPADRFSLALAQYGLLAATMQEKQEDVFDKYEEQAIDHLNTLVDDSFKAAECKAVLSAIYGFKIAYTPWKGMFFGPKSANLIEEAIKDDDGSPIVWKLQGNNKYFTPETWGGDLNTAISSYEKAIALYETNGVPTANWIYLDTYAWLGQAYMRAGKPEMAIKTYEKGLQVEKDFNWVKYGLLPAANK